MITAISDELKERLIELSSTEPKTIYFGGGTPSLLERDEIKTLLQPIFDNYPREQFSEITLEANPEDITEASLIDWKELGINRLSIGIQSFKETDLTWMNRAHTLEESRNCIDLAKKLGFSNISVDLMYGLPELALSEWEQHIDEIISFDVNHISAYCLTVEKGTLLQKKVHNKIIQIPDEHFIIEQYKTLIFKLKCAGIEQYEISNFSKKGCHSIHNSNYWTGQKFIGIGPSAHSFDGKKRRWNISNNTKYIKKMDWYEEEVLSNNERWNEYILTRLRTTTGINLEELEQQFTIDQPFERMKEKFKDQNWLLEKDNQLLLTFVGQLKADYIASEFFRI
jgi:oxygen-independent coproporphyrinogen-3 oxidase